MAKPSFLVAQISLLPTSTYSFLPLGGLGTRRLLQKVSSNSHILEKGGKLLFTHTRRGKKRKKACVCVRVYAEQEKGKVFLSFPDLKKGTNLNGKHSLPTPSSSFFLFVLSLGSTFLNGDIHYDCMEEGKKGFSSFS